MNNEDKWKIIKYSTFGMAINYLIYGLYKSVKILSYETQEVEVGKNLKKNTILYKNNNKIIIKEEIIEPKELKNLFFEGISKKEISRVDDIRGINNIESFKNEVKKGDSIFVFFNSNKKLVGVVSKENCNKYTFLRLLKNEGYLLSLNSFLFFLSMGIFYKEKINLVI